MEFDYFYGPEDAEQYQFYRIPKLLITSDQFKDVSVEAKLLYGLMLDRLSLSIKNGWFDALNRAYIIYTIDEVMEDIHCRSQKACKLVAELEKTAGLIKKKRQGLGKPSLIYVLKFSTSSPQNSSESKLLNFENQNSGDVKIKNQEFRKSQGNKTNQNKTEINKTNPILLSVNVAGMDEDSDEMGEDPMESRKSYEKYFRYRLAIDDLKQSYPYDHGRIDEILELLVDTVCSTAKTIRCAGEDRPAEVVKSRFMKLDYGHIQYVLDCIHDNTTEVRNIKAYMLTTLYNGRGGKYYLYSSGDEHSVLIPLRKDIMLINHTHPKGTPYASDKDMRLMSYLKQLGSPQKTSTIYPVGKKPVKYDRKRRKK